MDEDFRAHYLRVLNQVQELAWKYGPVLEPPAEEIALMPTWGPDGSLAARCMTDEAVAHLMRDHARMIEMERQRYGTPPDAPPEPRGADW